MKVNSPDNLNNYHGITILSCFGNVLTSILNNRLNTCIFLESPGLLCEEQAGSRKTKNYGTVNHLLHKPC